MNSKQLPAMAGISGKPLDESSPAPTEIPASPRRPILKHALFLVFIALAGIAAVRTAHHWWTVGRFIESTDDAYVGGNVTVIASEVPGFIQRVVVEDNQQVHAGDLLIQLDDRDYQAALAKADASVAMQQAVLVNLEATRHLQDSLIGQARAEISSVAADISRTHDEEIRFQKLLAANAVSTQAYQQADTDHKRAQAGGDKAQSGLDAAQRQLEVIASGKLQAEAALQQAIALRESARLNLDYTKLRAPVDGIVGNRSAQLGAYAGAGSQLVSLVPVHGLWIDANFKESQIAEMHPGSPASVRIDSIPGKVFQGRVASLAPATGAQFSVLPPENATGNFTRIVQRLTVRIVLDDDDALSRRLRPGLSVKAEVDTRSNRNKNL